jgi:hypothetical protein
MRQTFRSRDSDAFCSEKCRETREMKKLAAFARSANFARICKMAAQAPGEDK